MNRYVPEDCPQERETEYAIANRERIRRLYLRGYCDLCGLRRCLCEELTDPNRKDVPWP